MKSIKLQFTKTFLSPSNPQYSITYALNVYILSGTYLFNSKIIYTNEQF